MKNALRTIVSTFGGFSALMGVEHGIGEILQGNTAPDHWLIQSWPDSRFFEILGGEPALTVIPNLLITGVLAVLVSLAYFATVVFWPHRKHASLALVGLALLMLLVGGGIFPPVLGLLMALAAGWIDRPGPTWAGWLPAGLRQKVAATWPWWYAAGLAVWLGMFPGVPVMYALFGWANDFVILGMLVAMFKFLLLAALTGMVRDDSRRLPAAA